MKKRAFCLWLVVLLVLCSACAAEESKGILYRITNGRSDMYLLGSIHIGSREMYPLNDTMMQALQNADVLVFECDTESAEAMQEAMSLMSYPIGESLEDYVSKETFEMLKQTAQKTGYPIGMLKALKPWAVVSMYSLETTAAEMGTDDIAEAMELGVENQIRKLADEKHVRYLETAREQLEMMDSFSPELQEYLLVTACRTLLYPEELSNAEMTLRFWPQWWREGNAEAFANDYYAEASAGTPEELMQEYHEKLLVERNVRMAQALDKLLQSEQSHFVTIGLLHLVLPGESVLSELEKMGYQIEKMQN